jgi:hypothetical protein
MDSSNNVAMFDRFGREIFPRQPNPIAVTLKHATSALNCPLVNGADTNGCRFYTKVCAEDRNAVAGSAKARQRRAAVYRRAYF